MKRFLSGMALAVAISMVSVAPALAVDLMGHTTPGAVNTIDSENYVPKAAFEVKAPLWDTRFGVVGTIDSDNYVPSDTASVRQPLLWHPRFGAISGREMAAGEAFKGLHGFADYLAATQILGIEG